MLLATSDGDGCGAAGSGVAEGAIAACWAGAWLVWVESEFIRTEDASDAEEAVWVLSVFDAM